MSEFTGTVLIIDDEKNLAETYAEALERVGCECIVATNGDDGLEEINKQKIDLVLTDLVMHPVDGMDVLRAARKTSPETEVIVITGHGTVKNAVQAMQQGAFNYLLKPIDIEELRAISKEALEKVRLKHDNIELRRQLDARFSYEGIIGNNARVVKIVDTLKHIAPTNATVLIYGESGTGKELVARAIHTNSPRKHHPFVALNCAALSEGILESELFGHEKGSFTGADSMRKGRFEYANHGTLFLDEVGDLPASTQVKLLRVIEQREILRVGSNASIKVDVRLVAATNRNLEEMVDERKFRQDLYFRLKVVTVTLPPLRERREDIPLLIDAFVQEFAKTHSRKISRMTPKARDILLHQDWPGNVRQLKNCIESMVVVSTDDVLDVDDLPYDLAPVSPAPPAPLAAGITIEEAERRLIAGTLESTKGNRAEASRLLGIGERTLYRKIKEYSLE
ncbi:MAG TPA: sigma-54 dependent transcriptional regulator [Planctomycetota bacterium]|nr:sigma-54 dependent transcriptional regulator [Planctomycetota bacterium]